jgi:hypothetical protein
VHYLGRAGTRTFGGLKVAYLSGIFAPRFFSEALEAPHNLETSKRAGYFRRAEAEALAKEREVDLLLLHEWPRGLAFGKSSTGAAVPKPWMGNRVAQELIAKLGPPWAFCGHSHLPWAGTVSHKDGRESRVVCLDQATRSEAALFWVEWQGREPMRAGWGASATEAWRRPEPWGADRVPSGLGGQMLSQ